MEIAFPRMAKGKISPQTTQAIGPQVVAKNAMYMQTKAIKTF